MRVLLSTSTRPNGGFRPPRPLLSDAPGRPSRTPGAPIPVGTCRRPPAAVLPTRPALVRIARRSPEHHCRRTPRSPKSWRRRLRLPAEVSSHEPDRLIPHRTRTFPAHGAVSDRPRDAHGSQWLHGLAVFCRAFKVWQAARGSYELPEGGGRACWACIPSVNSARRPRRPRERYDHPH